MAENARRAAGKRLLYFPYVEPEAGAGKGLLRALSQRAVLIVTDDFPCFFLPRMVDGRRAPGRVPAGGGRRQRPPPARRRPTRLRRPRTPFAGSCRRSCRIICDSMPAAAPLDTLAAPGAGKAAGKGRCAGRGPVPPTSCWLGIAGGARRACRSITRSRPAPCAAAAQPPKRSSRPSFTRSFCFTPRIATTPTKTARAASRPTCTSATSRCTRSCTTSPRWSAGRPKMSRRAPPARARAGGGCRRRRRRFLDQLVTWREVGYHFCHHRADYDRFESLPPWALATLAKHAADLRSPRYELEELAAARDLRSALERRPAAARCARGGCTTTCGCCGARRSSSGRRRRRRRSPSLIELNNRYALDGRESELLQRHLLVLRPLRPALGPGAADLRHGALHELRQHGAQAPPQGVSGAPRGRRAVRCPSAR